MAAPPTTTYISMAAALQDVTLKRGNEVVLKFRAGTKVDSIVHQLAAVCPGTRIEDAEGFVVTLGYLENLTQKEYTVIEPTPPGGNVGLDVVGSKIDEMLQIMKTNKVQKYTFSQGQSGKDTAVAATLATLGLSGFAPGDLPKRWTRGWAKTHYTPFTLWPRSGQSYEATFAPQLLAHFHARLCAYGVPLDAKDGFEFLDVHSHSSKLSFACTTAASTLIFSGGTDAVIVPYGAIVWQLQTRVLFHWKRPAELQSVESVLVQAQLELIGSLFNSNHPALVVFTDGINFVLLQPWGRGINFWHTFVNKPGHIVADDAMRLIAHHLLNISSRDPLFHHQEVDLRNSELSKELEPLLAAKRELGQGEGLAQQLDVDKDLPAHERFEGTFATILAWRESNLSYFS
ncbi:TPA: hypothetical protein ACH3X2_008038 [Trebouxia sp. C0005]